VTEIVDDLWFDDYLARPGISQSMLKTFDYDSGGCPALFKYQLGKQESRKETEALAHGRRYHKFLLEPDSFAESFAVYDTEIQGQLLAEAVAGGSKAREFSARLGTFIRWQEKQEALGKETISQRQSDELYAMRDSIMANSEVAEWFSWEGAKLEQSLFSGWKTFQKMEDGGQKAIEFQLKARVDINPAGSDALLDVKTARTAHPDEFAKAAWKLGYHIQAAFYIDRARANGLDKKRFGFLAQDKFPPYLACIHWLGDDWIRYGRIRYTKILLDIADAVKRNDWPGYRSGELMPPSWAQTEIESAAA
jgi:hypothetical protein